MCEDPQPTKEVGLVKSLLLLWTQVLADAGTWCCVDTSLDQKHAEARFDDEGLSYLTIALPSYASDLHRSLELGEVSPSLFTGFKKRGALPLFLGGFMDLVFDRASGRLLDEPDIQAVAAMRQVCMLLAKVEIECSDARNDAAVLRFIECEHDVHMLNRTLSAEMLAEFSTMVGLAFAPILTEVDRLVYEGEILPKHGPGATADGLAGNRKFEQRSWTRRLEQVFPSSDFLIPSYRYHEVLDSVDIVEPEAELPVKVTLVPKTQKTPRVIAVEPTCMQYVQQGIAAPLVRALESSWLADGADNIVFGLIGFSDQMPNQQMARRGSLSGELATLDLSEASDRVSYKLVQTMLQNHPWLAEGVDACRSRTACVPGTNEVIRLAKFASMGSALCFPIESMVFLAIVLLGIQDGLGHRLTRSDVKHLRGRVRVYGDDMIVPADLARHVIARLEAFGLRVNASKSFWTGKFRESCGGDYYDGVDVTPFRVRRVLPSSRADVHEIVSTVALRNLAYHQGYWKTAAHLDGILEPMLRHYPVVSPESRVLGRTSFLGYETQRMCPYLFRPLVRGWVKRDRIPPSPLEGPGALLKVFLKRGDEPFADREHLERQGRPETVGIKLRWDYSA
jgi:hypothetical protein